MLTHKEVTSGLVCDKISHPRKMQDSIRFLSGHGSSISDYHRHSGLEIASELATRFEKRAMLPMVTCLSTYSKKIPTDPWNIP